jgi:HEAT repeat protein
VTPQLTARFLGYLDGASENVEGAELNELVSNVQLLVALAPEQVFERLELSENRRMRRILLEALATGGPSVMPLARRRLESHQWFVVRNAIAILPRLGGRAAELAIVSRHPNDKVRLEVIRALRAMPIDEATSDIIAAYIVDPSPEIRRYSLPMLRGEILSQTAIARLERIANDEKEEEELRRRVINALGRSPQDAAAQVLFTTLQPKGLLDIGSVRESAAVALRHSPAPRARPLFEEGLRSSERRVRKACEKALAGG